MSKYTAQLIPIWAFVRANQSHELTYIDKQANISNTAPIHVTYIDKQANISNTAPIHVTYWYIDKQANIYNTAPIHVAR